MSVARGFSSAVEQAVADVSNDEQALRGTVRIAAPHCFGETVVPEALTLVRAAYPQLDLELVLNDRIVDLVTEGVDISFRLGQLGEGAFIARQLGQVGRVLVAAPGYLSQHDPITEPSDLSKTFVHSRAGHVRHGPVAAQTSGERRRERPHPYRGEDQSLAAHV